MQERINKLLIKSMWVVIAVFLLRCAVSAEEIKNNSSFYMFYGYAGEAIGIATIVMILYEKWLWRIDPFSCVPCVKGCYSGYIFSKYDSMNHDATMEIKQTYLSVGITMSTGESESRSITASIECVSGIYELVFMYQNNPKAKYRDRSQIHYGTARLNIIDKEHLVGSYYTDRNTMGDLDFLK